MSLNILSRVADRVYWLGRYLERADATARLITVHANLLMDLPVRLPLGWGRLVAITGAQSLFENLYGPNAEASERNVCKFMTTDERNPGCIVRSLGGARENARNVRETMPRVTFEYINDLYQFGRTRLSAHRSASLHEALDGISRRVQQLEGFLSQHMLHDAPWELLRLGNHIERADMTTRMIDMRSPELFAAQHDLEPFQNIQWRSILRSTYAMQAYVASVRDAVSTPLVLQFLFKDERLPRAYLRSLRAARRSLDALPRNEQPLRACSAAIAIVEQADVEALGAPGREDDLHTFIDECQVQLGNLHQVVVNTYFEHPRLATPSRDAKATRAAAD